MKSTRLLIASLAGMLYRSPDFGGESVGTPTPAAAPAAPAPINNYVNMVASSFHFKTDKPTEIKDEAGKVIETIPGKKPPSVQIYLPVPKPARLVEMLSDTTGKFAKETELLLSAVHSVIFGVARSQINDFREKSPTEPVTPAVVNYDLLDWTLIANMPKSERGSFVPAEEDVKAFLGSYLEVMPAATGKDVAKIKNHIDTIASGFKKIRQQKDILEFFSDAISIYVTSAPSTALEDHAEVIEYYQARLARMLKVEEKVTMADF